MKKLLLFGVTLFSFAAAQAQNCSELFFSEYAEGAGNNKALEVYNPTNATVDLSNYRIVRYSNGSLTGTDSTDLVGSVAAFDVFVLVNGQTTGTPTSPACDPALQALANQLDGAYPVPTYFNGDDAICLARKSPYKIVDIFGKIGEDPGTAWTDDAGAFFVGTGTWLTNNHTLIRKATVQTGVTVNPDFMGFDTFAQWDTLPNNTWSYLKTHQCACGTIGLNDLSKKEGVNVYPNPTNGTELTITTVGVSNSIKLINALGEVILEKQTATLNEIVSLKNLVLAKGIYFVEVKNNSTNSIATQKVIVQ